MEYIIAFASLITEPWVVPTSLFFALAILETERRWVRARRQRGFRYSPLSHLLDALVAMLAIVVLAAVSRVLLQVDSDRLLIAAAPLAWAIGLILILAVGFSMIRRLGPAGSVRRE